MKVHLDISNKFYVKFEVVMMKIQVGIFWLMTSCSCMVRYQCFGGACSLHHQNEYWGSM